MSPSVVRLSRFAVFYGVLFAAGLAWAWSQGRGLLVQEALRLPTFVAHAAIGALVGLLLVVVSQRLSLRFDWARKLDQALAETIGPFSAGEAALVAGLSALGEEALFRGAMQPAIGIVLTALAFGLLHVGPSRVFLPWTAMAIGVGFLFGGLLLLTGDLITCIVAHAAVNFFNLRYLTDKYRSAAPAAPPAG
jgi:uncharacterized protein